MKHSLHPESQTYSSGLRLMGNHFEFSAVSDNKALALKSISVAIGEVKRIERLLTTFDESSETNRINAAAGLAPIQVAREVFDLIERSLKISALTQGAFDITYGSIDKRLWNFDTAMRSLPDKETARAMVKLIDYRNVVLDRSRHTVFLRKEGMRIGFGGIGKGYAADRAKAVMQHHGIESGIVNAAGDLTVWGRQASEEPWTIGIADPERKDSPFASMQLTNISVATSGTYEKYAMIDGRKYSHTIDPNTGYPVHGIKSVTIICGSAEIADALATPVMVMGTKAGMHLINQIKGVECIIIDECNQVYVSDNINLNRI